MPARVQPLSAPQPLVRKHVSSELPVTDIARGVTFSRNGPLGTMSPAKLRFAPPPRWGDEGLAFQIKETNKKLNVKSRFL